MNSDSEVIHFNIEFNTTLVWMKGSHIDKSDVAKTIICLLKLPFEHSSNLTVNIIERFLSF